MVHYAQIGEHGIVQRVVVCDSHEWCTTNLGGTWVRTYYDTKNKIFAGVGYTYHLDFDNFSPPQPYPSWRLDKPTMAWNPPVPYPHVAFESTSSYVWDEETQAWVIPT